MRVYCCLLMLICPAVFPSMGRGAATPDRSTPRAAAAALYRAIEAADAESIAASFSARTEEQKKLARAMADLLAAGRRLQIAARQRFGKSAEPLVADMTMGDELKRIDEATVNQKGDRAELTLPEAIRPMVFVRIDGQWKLEVMDYAGADEKQLPKQVKRLTQVAAVLQQAAQKIADDQYDTPEAARKAIVRQLETADEEQ